MQAYQPACVPALGGEKREGAEGLLVFVDRHLVQNNPLITLHAPPPVLSDNLSHHRFRPLSCSSPPVLQAFEGLRVAGRTVRRPDCTLATVDHNVPTSDRSGFTTVEAFIQEADSRTQVWRCGGWGLFEEAGRAKEAQGAGKVSLDGRVWTAGSGTKPDYPGQDGRRVWML
eukprot:364050-Chlamydomonas_euryale.AAC.10